MVCWGENCSSCKYLEFQISLSLSTSLQSEAQTEKYKDLRALLQLLTNICSKDLVHLFRTSAVRCVSICWFPGPTFFGYVQVDFSSFSDEAESTDIAEVSLMKFLSLTLLNLLPISLQVIYVGLHIVTPLISLELLKYPKLSCDVSLFQFYYSDLFFQIW